MTQKRAIRIVATGTRLLVGVVVAVACVAGVTAAVALPWPEIATTPAQVAVTPAAGDTTLVCNGQFRAIGRDPQNVTQMFSAGVPDLTVDSNGPREDSEITASDLTAATSGPQRFVGSAEQGGAALIGAAESISLAAEDLSGYAAAPCREPSTESWLVGGTVETGTNDLIILSNPGDVTSTATITAFGAGQSSTSTIVPAGTQLAVPLASIAAGLQQPVVRVTAAGAPLRAVLQSSLIRTLDPSGIDLQDTAGAPRTELSFAGVQVIVPSGDSPLTVLRLMATDQAAGSTVATVTVRANGEDARELTAPLDPAIPTELSLEGLDPGVYSVDVTAQTPVVGAIWQATRIGAGSDFSWMTPAPEFSGEVLVAVPVGPTPRLHLVNSQDTDASVTLTPTAGGASEQLTVPAGSALVVDVTADTSYSLSTDTRLKGAVIVAGKDALAGWPIWPSAAAQDPITVYP
ncbi:hypothetical protein DC31_09690 [Microbacterium sp. CH12i]|uniref:DUF5719 family protein n=1 Tax=Microbacterium sp. CH12i TaxID=1479651 RepID=UPI000461EFAD|nr:DUF5719 family protein [Microbacterium sp. CH12i]KDA06626.1 hypothetical protein DC31_09690 [Microbacterium sp. CH12i]